MVVTEHVPTTHPSIPYLSLVPGDQVFSAGVLVGEGVIAEGVPGACAGPVGKEHLC